MIRTVFENLLLFLLPTLIYAAWILFTRARRTADDDSEKANSLGSILNDAPLVWLFVSGAFLVIVTLTFFGSSSGGKPGQQYQPSVFKDGKIQPSHID
ncbi:DUF6111 family protein [Hyphomicrobium sp. LHD-15]|uniref:DUF6111 family protein n=1 Tax=Hyphomicrobium sp. LHD-15 TaxID=3072142 RepID=UPI00280D68F0|nr:DUF6111 family protein [Hyphomicrobium sp. LHD-15]MDQ8697785.1 DUF6111 family protein [Hyphomicrobium sp. LHD-15]